MKNYNELSIQLIFKQIYIKSKVSKKLSFESKKVSFECEQTGEKFECLILKLNV